MVEIKSYLGFTDNIKEPQKTKVENTLDHLYRYNGKIMSAVNFLCTKILEGGYLKVEKNYTTLKRNGERTKPKTLYMFFDKDTKTYTELKKTEYDFVQYLLDNKIDTEEKILARSKADIEKMETDKRAKEEERKRQLKEKEEEDKFKEWMFTETTNLPDFQIEIINSIFLSLYGKEDSWNYTLAVCINNYDKPRCKDEVKSRLHNDNKASIKIFECLTGLKLPKGYKDRIAYLDSITSADFKEAVGYKIHNKSEKRGIEKEVQKEEFYILLRNFTWQKVLAEPVKKYGIKMFLFCDCDTWKLSHEETGLNITSGKNKTECMQKLKECINKNGKDKFNELVENRKKGVFEKAGVNPKLASKVA